jgi:hypothetical protein
VKEALELQVAGPGGSKAGSQKYALADTKSDDQLRDQSSQNTNYWLV